MPRQALVLLAVGLMSIGLAAAGCSRAGTPPATNESNGFLLAPDDGSNDPYACNLQRIDRASPFYPSLSDGGVIQSFEPVNDGNASYLGLCKRDQVICWYTREDQADEPTTGRIDFTFDMVCQYTCDKDSDCPAPSAGTSIPTCVNANPAIAKSGQCALVCAGGRTCPTGFACTKPLLGTVGPDYQQIPSPEQCLQTKTMSAPPPGLPITDAGGPDYGFSDASAYDVGGAAIDGNVADRSPAN